MTPSIYRAFATAKFFWFDADNPLLIEHGPFDSEDAAQADIADFIYVRQQRMVAIARVTHELNRAYCVYLGDNSQPSWEDAPAWQRDSAIAGVQFHIAHPEAGASASHDSWMQQKHLDGWIYGKVKDPEASPPTHPCMVPFEELPPEQQLKDTFFRNTVHALWELNA